MVCGCFFFFLILNVCTCYVHSLDSLKYIYPPHKHTKTNIQRKHIHSITKIQHDVCHIKLYTLCVVLGDCSWLSEFREMVSSG